MSAFRTISPAEDRLLDAALQQVLAETPVPASTPRSPHWLLVAVLLLAVGITATTMWQARHAASDEAQEPQRTEPSEEVHARNLDELAALPASTTNLRLTLVDPRGLEAISRFEGLRALHLGQEQSSLLGIPTGYHRYWSTPPADLFEPLAKLTKLETLSVPCPLAATPGVLVPLVDHPALHTIEVSGDGLAIDARLVRALATMSGLRAVKLHLVPIDAAALHAMAKLPLTSLELKFCRGLDRDGWRELLAMRTLRRLSFQNWSWNVLPGEERRPPGWHPGPADLEQLRELPALRTLELNHCEIGAAQLDALPDTLTSLHLFGNNLAPADLDALRRFGSLRELVIDTRRRDGLLASVMAPDPEPEAEALASAIATLRLHSLHYHGALVPTLATALGSNPDLRELTLDSKALDPKTLARMLGTAQLESLRLRQTLVLHGATTSDLVRTLAGQRRLRVLELPVDNLEGLQDFPELPRLQHLTLAFTSQSAGQSVDPAELSPLTRSATLRDLVLRIYLVDGQPPIATRELQEALGTTIRLHVQTWGVVRR